MSLTSFLQILAGVGILIYGIIVMGDSLQIIAGDRLRRLIGSLTGTPVKGLLVGTAVTGILQSSSATTVMVVSFVDVGLMTLNQAIGVILGANIGTTVTAQLIAFKITDIAYLCAVFGAGLCILCKKRRNKQIGVGLVGFGLLFIGMEMMQGPMAFLKTRPDIMTVFGDHVFLAFLSGLAVTLLIQSSSATVGLTMAIAAQGVIPLNTAIAIILGDNIGTTITAVLASLGANRSAKQAACAHVMIKILGTAVVMPILPFYTSLIAMTSSDISRQVANAHSIFSVIIALIFLPFVAQYAKFIRKIIPDDKNQEVVGAMFLNSSLISASSAAAVDAVRKEMIRLGVMALRMIENCRSILIDDNEKLVTEVDRAERNVNELTHEIVRYATEVGQSGLPPDLSLLLNSCVSGVGDIERIGDHATNLIEMYEFLKDHKLKFSAKAREECQEMFDLVISAVARSIQAIEEEDPKLAQEVVDLEDRIDYMEKTLRAQHIARLNAGSCNPGAGVVFIDILSNLERVGDHAHNLAMVVFDIERMHKRSGNSKR
jgi:phosphate:Na+ symporter